MNKRIALKITYPALCLALALVLPLLTGQIPQIGAALGPMHIAVFLCGFLCGWQYGLAVGFAAPLLRFAIFGMPPIYPTGIAMAFELAAYGLVSGLLYKLFPKKVGYVYLSQITAMVAGRIVWGLARLVIAGLAGTEFPFSTFLIGGFADALPGILLQIILLPPLFIVLQNAGKAKMDCEG